MKESLKHIELLLKNFPDLTRLPGSIPELRKLILQRAVRGELTADWRKANPDTEPASELLEKIKAVKARLVKAGKIKKQKPIPEIGEDEVFNPIPERWTYGRLGSIIDFQYGKSVPKENISTKGSVPIFGANGVLKYGIKPLIDRPCIIVGRKGSAGALNICLTPCWPADVTYYVLASKFLNFQYSYFLLKSCDLPALAKGIKPGLNRNEANELVIPLPPLAEQQEIVTRVERLLGLCDQLEASQETEEYTRVRTRRAFLAALDSDSGFPAAWRAVHGRFDSLIRTPEDVRELRKTILQLAVQGRLTEDWRKANPDVEPASVLLEKIKAEKARLVKAGRIKKQKPLPEIGGDEVPFVLPEGWEWTRLGEVMLTMSTGPFGSMLHKADYVINGVPIINPTNIKCGVIVDNGIKKIKLEKAHQLSRYQLFKGDIVLARRGDLTKCAIIKDEQSGYYCGTGSFFLRTPTCIFEPFFALFYSSSTCQGVLDSNSVGTTMNNLNQSLLKILSYPLMSFSEQQEIVARVERLLGMCDQLEADLADAGETGARVWRALQSGVN